MSAVVKIKTLPDGWELFTLGDLTEYVTSGSRNWSKYYADEGALFIRTQDIKNNALSNEEIPRVKLPDKVEGKRTLVKKGDLLITITGYIGRVASIDRDIEEAYVSQSVALARLKNPDFSKFIQYQLLTKQGGGTQLENMAYGMGRPVLNLQNIKDVQVKLPDLEKQKHIVAKIEELFSHIDAGIEALKKAKQLLKQYRQSVLKAAVTGELTKEWREANKDKLEPASQLLERILKERREKWEEQQLEQFKAKGKIPKDDKWKEKYKELSPVTEEEVVSLPKLPVGWIYTRLGNVIDEPKYGTSKKCSYDASGIGVLRIPNVAHGAIDSEDLKYAKFDDAEVETYKLNEGDILTIRSNGSINLVGKCALIDANDTKYIYAGYLIRLRPNSEVVAGSYLINAFNSMQLRQQIESKAKSTSGVNNINSGELQSLVIPMCSKEEQTISIKLVDEKLSTSDRLLKELNIQQIKAEKNKQSILATAFNGRLQ